MKANYFMLKTIINLIVVFACNGSYAQSNIQKANNQDTISSKFWNSSLMLIAKPESVEGWIKFKEGVGINPRNIFNEQKEAFNLNENDSMNLIKIDIDEFGYTHYYSQQYYKDIKIEGGEYIVHSNKNGTTYSANGKLFTDIDINVTPILNTKRAIDITLKHVNAEEYMWQSEFWENDLKERTGNPDTTYYPLPKLAIREIINNNIKPNIQDKKYFLVYRLDIYSSSPNYAQRIFLDANTGIILETFPLQSN